MDWFFKFIFPIFFIAIFALVIGTFATIGYLGYQCYNSGDPNSMACYMTSERMEHGIRYR